MLSSNVSRVEPLRADVVQLAHQRGAVFEGELDLDLLGHVGVSRQKAVGKEPHFDA